MARGTRYSEGEVTPYRKTRVYGKLPEPTMDIPSWFLQRFGKQITPNPVDVGKKKDISVLGNYALTLKSFQEKPWENSEFDDSSVVSITDLGLPVESDSDGGFYQTVRMWRPADFVPGGTGHSTEFGSRDPFQKRYQTAGTGAQRILKHIADEDSFGKAVIATADPLDRHAVSLKNYDANQGFNVRFILKNIASHFSDVFTVFYFGGEGDANGYGSYALALSADGTATLYEKIVTPDYGTDIVGFNERDSWSFASVHAGSVNTVHFLIRPVYHPQGSFIEFIAEAGDATEIRFRTPADYYSEHQQRKIHTVECVKPKSAARNAATAFGPIRLDVAQSQFIRMQISTFKYPANAIVRDGEFYVPFFMASATDDKLHLTWTGTTPDDSSIIGELYRLDTNPPTALPLVTGGIYNPTPFSRWFRIEGDLCFHYYAKFTLYSNSPRNIAPVLWGYGVARDATYTALSTTAEEAVIVNSMRIVGADSDTTHETASFILHDLRDQSQFLRNQGGQSVLIDTEYDPTDSTKRSILFRGYVGQAVAKRKPITSVFAKWKDYEVTCQSMSVKLKSALAFVNFNFNRDPNHVEDTGAIIPWKVTDIVRLLLGYAGYPDSMIDVPDSPLRVTITASGGTGALQVSPGTSIYDFIQQLLKGYLGWHLYFDSNAGYEGMWRLLKPKRAPYTPICRFTMLPPDTTDGPRLIHVPASYADRTDVLTTFIERDSYHSILRPPEANFVQVVGTTSSTGPPKQLSNVMAQPKSLNHFGASTVDLNSPDFLPGFVPLIVVDTSLNTQKDVDILCRRYYEIACYATKTIEFSAPLVLVSDPLDLLQTRPRPMRYYDPVLIETLEGEFYALIRNVSVEIDRDMVQRAHYELEVPRI